MKKKGFTLIELLAVIVILAIIALIATPLVLNTIEKAKEGAAKASAYAYAEEVERYIILSELDPTLHKLQTGVEYQLSSKKYEVAALADPTTTYINDLVSIKGDKPTEGYLKLDGEYKIEKMEMVIKSYPVTCENDKCEVTGSKVEVEEDEEKVEKVTGPTAEDPDKTTTKGLIKIVYLDPTDLTKTCNSSNSVSTTGTKSGCMKWYAYAETDTTYTMILDHNTTPNSYWSYDGTNTVIGSKKISELDNNAYLNEVMYDLNQDTKDWVGSLNARLITPLEVADITDNQNYDVTDRLTWYYLDSNDNKEVAATTPGSSKYAWLYDNLHFCTGGEIEYGCNNSENNSYTYTNSAGSTITLYTWTYWSSVKTSDTTTKIWNIGNMGCLGNTVANSQNGGIRPVITVSKDIIK